MQQNKSYQALNVLQDKSGYPKVEQVAPLGIFTEI